VRRWLAALLATAMLPAAAAPFDHEHRPWDALLKKNVVLLEGGKASRLDYAGVAREHAVLKAYLASLSAVGAAEFDAWPKAGRMAFLINAYNAFTVEKVLQRYPEIRSIRDFGRLFGNPFRDEFFSLFGRRFSLDAIEHETLRAPGAYDEPRVHYALNCAAIGCPMLREEAYVAARLERQLEEQAVRFLSDRARNRLSADGRLEVSRIFDWFKEDFGVRERYFAAYAKLLADDPEGRRRIAERRAALAFLDYDWALNDVRR
jgi:hypothetical protein